MSQEFHEGMASAPMQTGLPVLHQPDQEVLIAREDDRRESGASSAIWSVLDKLEQTLDHENAQLATMGAADFGRLNETKSRLLLDASRAARALREDIADVRLMARLETLRAKLEQNRLTIGMHLEAVREIAAAMTTTLIDAESDGTYNAWSGAAGKAQTA